MKVTRSLLLGIGTALTLVACGGAHDANSKLTDAAALNEQGAQLVLQIRLIEGDFNPTNNSPECLALRGKLFAKRQAVKISSEWGTIKQTEEYKAFDRDEDKFNKFGCKAENPDATQQCHDMQAQLEADALSLSNTAQWKTLANNTNWQDLQEDYAKAKQVNCL